MMIMRGILLSLACFVLEAKRCGLYNLCMAGLTNAEALVVGH